MSIQRVLAAAAMLAVVGLPVQADTGSSSASTTIEIRGVVPVICRVQLSNDVGTPDQEGVASLGVTDEFCNAPRGYRVVVQTPADLDGAALISGGMRIPLAASGETVLTDSDHPDLRRTPLAVDLGAHPERFTSLGVRIEAKA